MKIVIGILNSKYIHASLAPWCLASGVNSFCRNKHQTKVLESTINSPVTPFAEEILKENADVIALCCYIWNIEQTLKLCKILKEKSSAKIVLGGPEVAYRSKVFLEEEKDIADFVLSGEGEWNFPLLIDALYENLPLTSVWGLTFYDENYLVSIPEKQIFETPPSPYTPEFFENLKGRISYIETSRGCPFRCAFCLSGRCSPLRFFDIEKVKNNIISLANGKTKTIKFVDRTFNCNEKRANEILQFIIDEYGKNIPKNICFHFEIAGDILKNSTMEILKSAPKGLFQLEIGMQSFNEDTLKKINRKTDTKKLIQNIKTLVSFNNMHIHIDLIAGLTGEDSESFKNSFNIGFSLNAHMLQMGFLKLLYGADMRENREKYPCTFNDTPPYEVTSTPWLSSYEISCLKNTEDALERMYNSGRFLSTLYFATEYTKMTPFDLLFFIGNRLSGEGMPLYEYALKLYDVLSELCPKDVLREKIVSDLILSCSNPKIPDRLKVKDPNYKKIKARLKASFGNVNFVILYSKNQILYVNSQKEKKDFRGRYKGNLLNIENE